MGMVVVLLANVTIYMSREDYSCCDYVCDNGRVD